jgi:hypothetical protein
MRFGGWASLPSALDVFKQAPIERQLRMGGVINAKPPASEASLTLRIVVGDTPCLDCAGITHLFVALRGLDASVWGTHHELGSLQLLNEGRVPPASHLMSVYIPRGDPLVFTATGPDAEEALEVARVMLEAPPDERRNIYRRLR